MNFDVSYTAKDLILYALSLGMGSTAADTDELMYLYEWHGMFSSVPTFFLTFTFWATSTLKKRDLHMNRIPPFPPPLMADEQVIPKRFLRNRDEHSDYNQFLSNFPVIHTWQSIIWHDRGVEIPEAPSQRGTEGHSSSVTVHVRTGIVAVQPKSIGTFVTTQTQITSLDCIRPICTMESSALVMGFPPEKIVPFDIGISRSAYHSPKQCERQEPSFQWSYQTFMSQALLYRMASGDSNHIHVDTSVSEQMDTEQKAPILHGLFTLALGFRAITKFLRATLLSQPSDHRSIKTAEDMVIDFRYLEGKFSQPAFVGDSLCVKLWSNFLVSEINTLIVKRRDPVKVSFDFVIVNDITGKILVDCGMAEVEISVMSEEITRSRL
ncbi:MaoC like domain containing protein [Nitzschia inconspicua]|uniref:MaoC like domain containing protein n=1 Tax=Nitzschia inconspicua TaxID=303405 RepID=A0A9K3LA37_9STRA|nr:MaoC like domain containing protein [Nitzschia inconspicua]